MFAYQLSLWVHVCKISVILKMEAEALNYYWYLGLCNWNIICLLNEFLDYPSTEITYSSSDETVTFGFSSPLPKGRGLLSMDFTGQLNDKLKGFYRSKYTEEDGSEKFCAATHFEVLWRLGGDSA